MKTGLGLQLRPVKMLAPRSWSDCVRETVSDTRGPGDRASTYIHWANKILVPHQNICHANAENDRENPGAYETFNGLLWRKLDELRFPESDATDVCENIVCNDERCWKEKPDHPLENVIHEKMGLNNNQIEGHVSPCELRKLEAVVTLLQRCHEKHEA